MLHEDRKIWTETLKTYAIIGQFDTTSDLIHGAEKVRDAGFRHWDVHTPFPVHGMDKAMGLRRSPVGYIAGISGFIGGAFALWLQWYTSAVDYPVVIAGKPFFSYQAFVPVTFGLTILFAAIGAVVGMLMLNRLPQPFHGLFYSERFSKFSDDGLFISIESTDPKFNETELQRLLQNAGAMHIELVRGE